MLLQSVGTEEGPTAERKHFSAAAGKKKKAKRKTKKVYLIPTRGHAKPTWTRGVFWGSYKAQKEPAFGGRLYGKVGWRRLPRRVGVRSPREGGPQPCSAGGGGSYNGLDVRARQLTPFYEPYYYFCVLIVLEQTHKFLQQLSTGRESTAVRVPPRTEVQHATHINHPETRSTHLHATRTAQHRPGG